MGQRHQTYVISNTGRMGFHCQWSYGTLPIRAVYRLFKFNKNADKYNKLTHTGLAIQKLTDMVHALLSVDYTEGMFDYYTDITAEGCADNPELGDNNDGITIIDLTDNKPKYAFTFLSHADNDKTIPYKALSAREYLETYYPENSTVPREIARRKSCNKHLKFLDKFEVLTDFDIKILFPLMFMVKKEVA